MASASQKMSQINVRMDSSLKQSVDETLARLGRSPSEIVRLVWSRLAAGGPEAAETLRYLESNESDAGEHDRAAKLQEGWMITESFFQRVGYQPNSESPASEPPWEDLYREAMEEHYRDRGLIV